MYGANLRYSAIIGVVAFALCWLIFDYFSGTVWPNPIDGVIGAFLMDIVGWANELLQPLFGRVPA
jgi:hypothetical protein